jgi:hypothetical protein
MIRTVMPRRNTALLALGIVLALAAALLPGAELNAFYIPTFAFVTVSFVWRMPLPQDPTLPALVYVRAPLELRGPPSQYLA